MRKGLLSAAWFNISFVAITVLKVFKITCLDRRLQIHEDRESAVTGLRLTSVFRTFV